MTPCPTPLRTAALVALATMAGMAQAGRPLAVDDANTNEKGAGHVEAWVARADGATAVHVSPAYAPLDGVELAATFSRDTTNKVNGTTLQLKWILTESQERGCNLGTSFGAAHVGGGGGNARFLNALATCNLGGTGSVHLNLGVAKPSGEPSAKSWGVAYERALGPVTPHLEFFGEKGSKPTVQVGARGEVARGVQLDGTVGRSDGDTLYTLGVKFQF